MMRDILEPRMLWWAPSGFPIPERLGKPELAYYVQSPLIPPSESSRNPG
jgi:hypothetical protein